MDQQDLRRFFGDMLKREGSISSEALEVFGKLIRLTIDFRDQWKSKKGEVLTVEDTRKAIDIYTAVLEKGIMPDDLDEKINRLVRLWLKKINGKTY
jgi:hypothetical protein